MSDSERNVWISTENSIGNGKKSGKHFMIIICSPKKFILKKKKESRKFWRSDILK